MAEERKTLTAVFKVQDDMTSSLENMANKGDRLTISMERVKSSEEEFGRLHKEVYEEIEKTININDAVSQGIKNLDEGLKEGRVDVDNYWEAYKEIESSQTVEEIDRIMDAVWNGEEGWEAYKTQINEVEQANEKVADSLFSVEEKIEEVGEESEDSGEKISDSVKSIEQILVAVGLTKLISEITSAVDELAESFSEAESTVVKMTGATEGSLDGLMDSTMDILSETRFGTLDTVSETVGELNTRLGLTGDELEEVSGKIIDFANVTDGNAKNSVANVTKIMRLYGLETSDLTHIMEELTVAGQMSGASVDSMSSTLINSSAILQNAGFSLENAINLMKEFELVGINSSSAMMGLRTAISRFAKEGTDAKQGISEVITEIQNAKTQSEATAIAVETFGTRAGQQLALAIQRGAISLESFTGTLGDTEGALESTANASQTLAQKQQQASNSMKVAFTNVLEPAVEDVKTKVAELTKGFGDWLQEHPAAVKALIAVGAELGTVVVVISAVVVAVKLWKVAQDALNGSLLTSPVTWFAIALGAVVAVIPSIAMESKEASNELTAVSKEQQENVESLRAEYEELEKTDGKFADSTIEAKMALEEAESQFEKTKMTVQELRDAIKESYEEMTTWKGKLSESLQEIEGNGQADLVLISQLNTLIETNDNTAESYQRIQTIVSQLNKDLPGLGLEFDESSGRLNKQGTVLEKYVLDWVTQNKQQTKLNQYLENISQQESKKQQLEDMEKQVEYADNRARETRNNLWNSISTAINPAYETEDEREAFRLRQEYNDTKYAYEDYVKETKALGEELGISTETTEEALNVQDEMTEAVKKATDAIDLQSSALQKQKEKYTEVYNAALESIQGQMNLTTNFANWQAEQQEIMNADVLGNLTSQAEYLTQYQTNYDIVANNLKDAVGNTFDLTFLEQFNDGTQESAAMLANLSGKSKEELKAIYDQYVNVQNKQEELAKTMGMQTSGLADGVDTAVNSVITEVEKLNNCDDIAGTAASDAMQTFVNTLGSDTFMSQIETVVRKINNKLSSIGGTYTMSTTTDDKGNTTVSVEKVEKHARGTLNSEDVFIAGEEGAELVVGKGGYRVYNAAETSAYFNAQGGNNGGSGDSSNRVIDINLNGNGILSVSGRGVSREDVSEILVTEIEPVLLDILTEELITEGDRV